MSEAENAAGILQAKGQEGVGQLTSTANRYSRELEGADLGEKLEAAVLQSFVKSMLPKDMETVYGGGTAGSMWQGLMAEQLANQLAKSGAVGLAEMLLPDTIRPTLPKQEA